MHAQVTPSHVLGRPTMQANSRFFVYGRATCLRRAPTGSRSYAARLQAGARVPRQGVRVSAMQSGWSPQPQQQPQQQQPQQPIPSRQAAPLARAPAYQAAPVFLELTQVLNKQVVTRTGGRSLGSISGAWLDPARGTLVSFDLDDRKPGSGPGLGLNSPARAGNIPLSALRQIGDVVLVHDESGLYEQDLDGRLGFVNPVGLDVKTRTGEFLGKVRDLSFSPDSGVISRITYDEFGLPFLPISFFDCYSVAIQDVLSIGRSDLIVYDDAKYRERKESNGLFAAIPSLLKSLNAPRSASPQLALPAPSSTSDVYRLGAGSSAVSSSSRYLPADYTYEQWQADLRRWEAETGMTYEQYLRSQPQQQQQPAARNALPPGRGSTQQPYQQAAAPGYTNAASAANPYLQPPQTGYAQQQQQQQLQQPYGAQPLQQYGYQQQQAPQQSVQQQQRYDARQGRPQQQYGAAAPQQQGMSAWGADAAAVAAANPYAALRYGNAAAAGQAGSSSSGYMSNPTAAPGVQRPLQQQQFRATQQQTPQQQQQPPPLGQTRPSAASAPRATQAAVGPRQQPRAPGATSAAQQPQQQQQPQGGQQGPPVGRPVDDWMVRETRPRMSDALADGVLPLGDGAAAADNGAGGEKQPQQQQQVQQPETA